MNSVSFEVVMGEGREGGGSEETLLAELGEYEPVILYKFL